MNNIQLTQLIRESIQEYIRNIDEAGENAALEAKMGKTEEAITLREKKINMEGIDEAYHDMIDKSKMKELASEVKALKKSLAKYEKQLAKLKSKGKTGTEVEDTETQEIVDENSDIDVNLKDKRYDKNGNPDEYGLYDAGTNYLGDEDEYDDSRDEYDVDRAQYNDPTMNEIAYMQKIAGIITEEEYRAKLKK